MEEEKNFARETTNSAVREETRGGGVTVVCAHTQNTVACVREKERERVKAVSFQLHLPIRIVPTPLPPFAACTLCWLVASLGFVKPIRAGLCCAAAQLRIERV